MGDSRRRGTRTKLYAEQVPERMRVVVMPRVWTRRVERGESLILDDLIGIARWKRITIVMLCEGGDGGGGSKCTIWSCRLKLPGWFTPPTTTSPLEQRNSHILSWISTVKYRHGINCYLCNNTSDSAPFPFKNLLQTRPSQVRSTLSLRLLNHGFNHPTIGALTTMGFPKAQRTTIPFSSATKRP